MTCEKPGVQCCLCLCAHFYLFTQTSKSRLNFCFPYLSIMAPQVVCGVADFTCPWLVSLPSQKTDEPHLCRDCMHLQNWHAGKVSWSRLSSVSSTDMPSTKVQKILSSYGQDTKFRSLGGRTGPMEACNKVLKGYNKAPEADSQKCNLRVCVHSKIFCYTVYWPWHHREHLENWEIKRQVVVNLLSMYIITKAHTERKKSANQDQRRLSSLH